MTKVKCILVTITSMFTLTGIASTPLPTPEDSLPKPSYTDTQMIKNKLDLYISMGPGFSSLTNGGTIYGEAHTVTTFDAINSTRVGPAYGVSLDCTWQHIKQKPINLSLGLGYAGTTFPSVQGTLAISKTGIPTDYQSYSFDAKSSALLFEQRLAYVKNNYWQPYVITGIGISWNTLGNYSGFNGIVIDAIFLTTTPGEATATTPFPNKTAISLAYEAGLGVQHPVSEHVSLATEYRYINFGKGEFGALNSTKVTGVPTAPNMAVNTLLLSLKVSFA